ncbi:Helix-loop-helix DNA-binding domain protein [Necator americanus]|uniref:Helix-loop-helix DNA-binding domain protein n=1 Tax=Necator americanus TaxID=51031 RepID=W2SU33_NECAM|nr:Helix-loop-helix DNA-binding domain protein [Necator americanus]ETN72331.1 Helix-loop-helix DNA-binding domain protein [Necator americanus]
MVRSESADEEMAVSDKFDATANEDDDEFSPQPIWATNGTHTESGKGNGGVPNRPVSRSASSLSPNSSDPDRRLRRQIANCNERRRMQSINAGFQSLRALLPRKEGEKLSKAAILQHTADLIQQLQSERSRYLDKDEAGGKKPKIESEFSWLDHNRSLLSNEEITVEDCNEFDQQRSMIDSLQMALERERTARLFLEQQLNQLREMYQNGLSAAVTSASANSPQQRQPQQQQTSAVNSAPKITTTTTTAAISVHDSVIRPTPLIAPISVDVSPRMSVPMPPTPSPLLPSSIPSHPANGPLSAPSAFSSSSITAHRSLQTILDAIRHLEGGALVPSTPSPPPPSSQAPLVR